MRQHDELHLRTALREEADRHRPDRDAMLDRINRARAGHRRPVDRLLVLLRPAAAALAVAVVLVLAVAGVRLSNRGPEVEDIPAAPPTLAPTTPAAPTTTATTAAPKPSTKGSTVTPTTSTPKPPRTTTGSPPSTRGTAPTPPSQTDQDGFLSSVAAPGPTSTDRWSEDRLVLKTTRTLTAVDVTVKVARTPGVVATTQWSTVSPHLLTITTSSSNAELVVHLTLNQGVTLAPGSYTFAVQFNHAAKRSAADDNFTARVTGEGKDAKVSGGFTAR